MRRLLALLFLGLTLAGCARGPMRGGAVTADAPRPRPDPVLQAELERLVAGFRGEVGVYVRHLRTGATASIRPDELFPTASMIKVPLLVTLYDRVSRGELRLEEELIFRDSLRYAPYDMTARFRDGETVPLSELAFLMTALSDNTASLWIQALVGGGAAVNQWLARNGFDSTRVNSRTPGRRRNWERYGWGQTTPKEIAELLVRIRQGRAVDPEASERMYRTLTKSYWTDVALSAIPPTVQAASKYGAVDRSRGEVLLVNAPGGDYVLAVTTRNNADTTYLPDNEAFRLIRDISGAVYRHFQGERDAGSRSIPPRTDPVTLRAVPLASTQPEQLPCASASLPSCAPFSFPPVRPRVEAAPVRAPARCTTC